METYLTQESCRPGGLAEAPVWPPNPATRWRQSSWKRVPGGGPAGFQTGKGFLPQTQRRDLSSQEEVFGGTTSWDSETFATKSSGRRSRQLPSHPPLDFYFPGLKRLGGCCAKAPKKFLVRPLPLPRGGPAASRTGDIPWIPAGGAGASRGGAQPSPAVRPPSPASAQAQAPAPAGHLVRAWAG